MTFLQYSVVWAFARFFVALAGLGCKQAIDKYTPQWLLLTVVALALAILLSLVEQHIKSTQAL